MRDTTLLEKVVPSLINAGTALILSLPLLYFLGFGLWWKIGAIAIFYGMQVLDTHRRSSFCCFGMRLFGTEWGRQYPRLQRNLYSLLYTASFATLFFSYAMPFDIFVFNMLILQVPSLLLTGTTFHGYLAGGMRSNVRATRRGD